jgi:hypothetical protein
LKFFIPTVIDIVMEEVFVCPNCHKNIPASNRTIHELRCNPIVIDDHHDAEVASSSHTNTAISSSSSSSAPPRGGWTCEKCTFFNENSSSHICEVCGTSCLNVIDEEPPQAVPIDVDDYTAIHATSVHDDLPPQPSAVPSNLWTCPKCTLVNSFSIDRCTACGETRPGLPARRERLINENDDASFIVFPDPPQRTGRGRGRGRRQPSARSSNIPATALFGAGLGAGLSLLNGRSMTHGAIEGASMGMISGAVLDMFAADMIEEEDDQPAMGFQQHRHGGPMNPFEFFNMVAANGGMEQQPQRVSEESIHQLPTRVYKSSEERRNNSTSNESCSCSICLSNFDDGDTIKMLPCFHQFHSPCIDRWLTRSTTCPVCKHSVEG